MNRRHAWLACVLLLLNACATAPRINGADDKSIESLQTWTASGRIGVSGVAQAGSGSFNWAQHSQHSAVQLRGPLGSGGMLIDYDGVQLTLRASDGTQYDADRALQELEARVGAVVPVAQLRYWLIGLAAPGTFEWRDEHATLQQDGWQIAYSDWLQQGSLRLPGRLVLTRDTLRVVMRVQNWQLP